MKYPYLLKIREHLSWWSTLHSRTEIFTFSFLWNWLYPSCCFQGIHRNTWMDAPTFPVKRQQQLILCHARCVGYVVMLKSYTVQHVAEALPAFSLTHSSLLYAADVYFCPEVTNATHTKSFCNQENRCLIYPGWPTHWNFYQCENLDVSSIFQLVCLTTELSCHCFITCRYRHAFLFFNYK